MTSPFNFKVRNSPGSDPQRCSVFWEEEPAQGRPQWLGLGESQDRLLSLIAMPHVTGHAPHAPHGPQLPSTEMTSDTTMI